MTPTTLRAAPALALVLAAASVTASATACARPESRAGAAPPAADSVALERGPCYGTCPTYRVVIGADGRIAYESRASNRITHVTTDGATGAVDALARRAEADGFFALPDEIMADRTFCRDRATDMPTATVTIWRAGVAKRVVDYRGCLAEPAVEARLQRLRALQTAVDSAAGTARWTQPRDRS